MHDWAIAAGGKRFMYLSPDVNKSSIEAALSQRPAAYPPRAFASRQLKLLRPGIDYLADMTGRALSECLKLRPALTARTIWEAV